MERIARTMPIWALIAIVAVAAIFLIGGRQQVQVSAAATPTPTTHTVTVTGSGSANGIPNTMDVDFSVHGSRPTPTEALNADHAAAHKVTRALETAGVEAKDLQTSDFNLDRNYNRYGNPDGWQASQTLTATITPLAIAGKAISAGATAAGTGVTVGNISFDVSKDKPLIASARANAYADAKAKAEQYAQLTGQSLGSVKAVTETVSGNGSEPFPDALRGNYEAAGSASPLAKTIMLSAGQQTVRIHVRVVWSLG